MILHPVRFPQDIVDRHFRFPVSRVGKHGYAVDIPGCIYIGYIGAASPVCPDPSMIQFHPDMLQPKTCRLRLSADAQKNPVRCQGKCLSMGIFMVMGLTDDCTILYLSHPGIQIKYHAFLLIILSQDLRNLPVRIPRNVVQHLHNGYLAACRMKIGGHLQSDDSASHNDKAVRNLRKIQYFPAGQHRSVFHSLCDA